MILPPTPGHRYYWLQGFTDVTVGVAILVLFTSIKFLWVGSWLWSLWLTHTPLHPYKKSPKPRRCWVRQASYRGYEIYAGSQQQDYVYPNICERCDSAEPLADRVYHCTAFDVHLPVYDHYCHWILVTVWLPTIKPYLLLNVFLITDVLFTWGVGI